MKATGACCVGLKALVHHFPLLSSQMTNQHPITPPPELRQLWAQQAQRMNPRDPIAWQEHIANQAAQWGADQELEACINYFYEYDRQRWGENSKLITGLRAARRPKPPSLNEQALEALEGLEALPTAAGQVTAARLATIRRALEALPE
jgi:hypothetical protein